MIVLVILSWIFLAFVLSGFLYLTFQWISAKEANYAFENKKEKRWLIFKRFFWMVLITGCLILLLTSLNAIPSSSDAREFQDYNIGEEFPWR